jgi:O-antigen ligase
MAAVDTRVLRRGPLGGTPPALLLTLLGLGAAFAAASAVTSEWVPMVAVVAVSAAAVFVLLCPLAALRVSFFLIVLSDTKFRSRDPMALLSGGIDGQVIFELGCYAAALLGVVVNLLPALGRDWRRLTRTELLLGAYVLVAVASVLWSANPQISAGRGIQLAILYLLCVVAARRLGPEPMLRTFAASLVLYVLLAAGLAAVFPAARRPGPLFSWFAVHPVEAGSLGGEAALIMIACALYAPQAWRHSLRRLALWAGTAACVTVLLSAHERAPAFAFFAAVITLWVRKRLRPLAAGLVLCAMLGLAGIGLRNLAETYGGVAAGPTGGNPIAVYILRNQNRDQFLSLSGRTDLWEYVYSLIREHPLIGHGYVASRSLMLARFPWAGTSHGAAMEIFLNLGLIGAALLGTVVVKTLASSFVTTAAPGAQDAWERSLALAAYVFLIVLAVANDSFAGVPGQLMLLFFAVTMAREHLREDTEALARSAPEAAFAPPRTAPVPSGGAGPSTGPSGEGPGR